ncbi:MAG: exodeoxyribonuclease VII small subunit [Oscillospiraceae bacterium]|nr:exodeoxyribonuclease VII small subunit [Oscillospiraceae bacterium]
MKRTEKLSFEDSMQRIEEIVRALEKGDKSLDDALGLFEEGTALIKGASKMLEEAEQRVVKLRKGPDGEPVESKFIEEDET